MESAQSVEMQSFDNTSAQGSGHIDTPGLAAPARTPRSDGESHQRNSGDNPTITPVNNDDIKNFIERVFCCKCSFCSRRKPSREIKYHRLKDRPACSTEKRAGTTEEFSTPLYSCDRLLSYRVFGAPSTDTQSISWHPASDRDLDIREGDTFSLWAVRAVKLLQTRVPDGLQLCAMAEVRPSSEAKSSAAFVDVLDMLIFGKFDPDRFVGNTLLMDVTANTWKMEIPPWLGQLAQKETYRLARAPLEIYPPSKTDPRDDSQYALNEPGNKSRQDCLLTRWGEYPRGKGNMDPQRRNDETFLSWQLIVPKFQSDWYAYFSEIHTVLPQSQYAKVMFNPKDDQTGCRLLVHFGQHSTLEAFNKKLDTDKEFEISPDNGGQCCWTPDRVVKISILNIFEIMINETVEFLQSFHLEMNYFSVKCRQQSSTGSKMKFLLHLEDHRRISHDGIKHGLAVLKTLESEDLSVTLRNRIKCSRKDLESFDSTLRSIREYLLDDQQRLQDRLQLTQELRSFRIALLAAIFLPLSFTTSIFGMNIVADTPDGPDGFSAWTQAALEQVPSNLSNATETLASVIGTSGSLNYTWKTFGITASCLIITLPLTLGIGALLRLLWSMPRSTLFRLFLFQLVTFMVPGFGYAYNGAAIMLLGLRAGLTHRKSAGKHKLRKRYWVTFLVFSVLFSVDTLIATHSTATNQEELRRGGLLGAGWVFVVASVAFDLIQIPSHLWF